MKLKELFDEVVAKGISLEITFTSHDKDDSGTFTFYLTPIKYCGNYVLVYKHNLLSFYNDHRKLSYNYRGEFAKYVFRYNLVNPDELPDRDYADSYKAYKEKYNKKVNPWSKGIYNVPTSGNHDLFIVHWPDRKLDKPYVLCDYTVTFLTKNHMASKFASGLLATTKEEFEAIKRKEEKEKWLNSPANITNKTLNELVDTLRALSEEVKELHSSMNRMATATSSNNAKYEDKIDTLMRDLNEREERARREENERREKERKEREERERRWKEREAEERAADLARYEEKARIAREEAKHDYDRY